MHESKGSGSSEGRLTESREAQIRSHGNDLIWFNSILDRIFQSASNPGPTTQIVLEAGHEASTQPVTEDYIVTKTNNVVDSLWRLQQQCNDPSKASLISSLRWDLYHTVQYILIAPEKNFFDQESYQANLLRYKNKLNNPDYRSLFISPIEPDESAVRQPAVSVDQDSVSLPVEEAEKKAPDPVKAKGLGLKTEVSLGTDHSEDSSWLDGFDGEIEKKTFIGKIETEDFDLYSSMFVTEIFDIGPSGEKRGLEVRYIDLGNHKIDSARQSDESDITLPIRDQLPFINLAVPLGYEVIGTNLGTNIQRSSLGTFRVALPENYTSELTYRIRESDQMPVLEQHLRERVAQSYHHLKQPMTLSTDFIANRQATLDAKLTIIRSGIASLDPVYSLSERLGQIYQASGSKIYTAIEAMDGTGICTTAALHLANRIRQHNIPALVAIGINPDRSKSAFNGSAGHAQTICWGEDGEYRVYDGTSLMTAAKSIDTTLIDNDEFNVLISDIPTLNEQELFARLQAYIGKVKDRIDEVTTEFQHNRPEWVAQDYKNLEEDNFEYTDLMKAIHWKISAERCLEQQKPTLEVILQLLENYRDTNFFSAHQKAFELADHRINRKAFPNLAEKSIVAQRHLLIDRFRVALSDAQSALLPNQLKQIYDRILESDHDVDPSIAQMNIDEGSILSTAERINFLPEDYLATLSNRDQINLCAKFVYAMNDSDSSKEALKRQSVKILALANTLVPRFSPDLRSGWTVDLNKHRISGWTVDLEKHRPYPASGVLNGFMRNLGKDAVVDEILSTLIIRLAEATGQTKYLATELILPEQVGALHVDSQLAIPAKRIETIKALAKTELPAIADYFTAEGIVTETFAAEFIDIFFKNTNYRSPYDEADFRLLAQLGINPAHIANDKRLYEIFINNKRSVFDINLPQYGITGIPTKPVSHTIIYGTKAHEEIYGKGLARTVIALNQVVPDSPTIKRIYDEWPECDEVEIYREFLQVKGRVQENTNPSTLNQVAIVLTDHLDDTPDLLKGFSIPVCPPSTILNSVIQQRPFLKPFYNIAGIAPTYSADDETWQSLVAGGTAPQLIWEKIYHDFPEIESDMRSKFDESSTAMYIRRQIGLTLTPTVKYQCETVLAMLLHNPPENREKYLHDLIAVGEEVIASENPLAVAKQAFSSNEAFSYFRYIANTINEDSLIAICLLFADMAAKIKTSLKNATTDQIVKKFVINMYVLRRDSFRVEPGPSKIISRAWKRPGITPWEPNKDVTVLYDNEVAEQALATLESVRSLTINRKAEAGAGPRFRQYASELLGNHTKTNSSGGLALESRNYQPGDDIRNIDWNAEARFNQLFTKEVSEQRVNPIHCVVEADWLCEGTPEKTTEPKNFRHLLMLLYLARKERIPIGFDIFWRGEKHRSFSTHELNQLMSPTHKEKLDDMVTELLILTLRINAILHSEKKAGVDLPPLRLMRKITAPPAHSNVLPLISKKNLPASASLIKALQKKVSVG